MKLRKECEDIGVFACQTIGSSVGFRALSKSTKVEVNYKRLEMTFTNIENLDRVVPVLQSQKCRSEGNQPNLLTAEMWLSQVVGLNILPPIPLGKYSFCNQIRIWVSFGLHFDKQLSYFRILYRVILIMLYVIYLFFLSIFSFSYLPARSI